MEELCPLGEPLLTAVATRLASRSMTMTLPKRKLFLVKAKRNNLQGFDALSRLKSQSDGKRKRLLAVLVVMQGKRTVGVKRL